MLHKIKLRASSVRIKSWASRIRTGYEEKLEVFASLEGKVDLHMLNAIAASLDLELSEGSLEEQYDTLKSCLMTLERYECNRLR